MLPYDVLLFSMYFFCGSLFTLLCITRGKISLAWWGWGEVVVGRQGWFRVWAFLSEAGMEKG